MTYEPLPNPKHEKFALALARGMSKENAYAEAGFIGGRTAASRLSTNVNILARVQKLQEIAQNRNEINVDTLLQELEKARKLSISLGQGSAAVLATMSKAKLLGLMK
ncbi:terminase small subunit [Pseudaquidulcibacter saccharophilus]|uniref:terminase small subunit n=1 Tax=Pseudaquidulcibacter saccharophilus TaxID=2831900 RepID=UPI001EFF2AFA|nr:terminase small subunit [Pseudaquidulcibacter saccharophilus]